METSAVSQNSIVVDDYQSALEQNSALDKTSFLELLVAQLSNQDPLEPIKNEDFGAQLAQYSSLEEMVKMNETMTELFAGNSIGQASSLIGKDVYGIDSSSGDLVEGVVESITVLDGVPFLNIGDKSLRLYDIAHIEDSQQVVEQESEEGENSDV